MIKKDQLTRLKGRPWGVSIPGEYYPAVEGPGNPGWEARHPELELGKKIGGVGIGDIGEIPSRPITQPITRPGLPKGLPMGGKGYVQLPPGAYRQGDYQMGSVTTIGAIRYGIPTTTRLKPGLPTFPITSPIGGEKIQPGMPGYPSRSRPGMPSPRPGMPTRPLQPVGGRVCPHCGGRI